MSQKLGKKRRRELAKAKGLHPEPGDPEISWSLVELYRWQHGELPPQDGSDKPLDESVAIRAMANAFENPEVVEWPKPFNVACVLRYAAKRIQQLKES
jgi:hypothetical protein